MSWEETKKWMRVVVTIGCLAILIVLCEGWRRQAVYWRKQYDQQKVETAKADKAYSDLYEEQSKRGVALASFILPAGYMNALDRRALLKVFITTAGVSSPGANLEGSVWAYAELFFGPRSEDTLENVRSNPVPIDLSGSIAVKCRMEKQ